MREGEFSYHFCEMLVAGMGVRTPRVGLGWDAGLCFVLFGLLSRCSAKGLIKGQMVCWFLVLNFAPGLVLNLILDD
jgi:hypothetical protein